MSLSHSPSVPAVWPLPAGLAVLAWLRIPPRFFGLLSGLLIGLLRGFGRAPAPDVAGGRRSNLSTDHPCRPIPSSPIVKFVGLLGLAWLLGLFQRSELSPPLRRRG
jgi:hypothetical protein